MPRRLRLVFDLDGTLIDSARSLARASNILLTELGRPSLDATTVKTFIGHGVDRLVERLLNATGGIPSGGPAPHQMRFRAIYGSDPVSGVEVYSGAVEALARLAAEGHGLAVCTQKPAAPARRLLEELGLMPPVSGLTAGDSLNVLKPDPRLLTHAADQIGSGRIIFIGDSEVDAEMARNARVPFILHLHGYRHGPLAAIPRTGDFGSFESLPDLLARMAERDVPS